MYMYICTYVHAHIHTYMHTYVHVHTDTYYTCMCLIILQGKISLNYHSDVLGAPDEKNKLFRFIVICGDSKRAYEIKAPDQQSKNEWLDAIKKVRAFLLE